MVVLTAVLKSREYKISKAICQQYLTKWKINLHEKLVMLPVPSSIQEHIKDFTICIILKCTGNTHQKSRMILPCRVPSRPSLSLTGIQAVPFQGLLS